MKEGQRFGQFAPGTARESLLKDTEECYRLALVQTQERAVEKESEEG